jgi:hypothetical protein
MVVSVLRVKARHGSSVVSASAGDMLPRFSVPLLDIIQMMTTITKLGEEDRVHEAKLTEAIDPRPQKNVGCILKILRKACI